MSFTKSITALFMAVAFLSSAVHASPLVPRTNTCDVKPTATSNLAAPISTPSVANAAACQSSCEAMSNCQSFIFGLPKDQSAPRCLLYAVPATSVPAQNDDNLVVFDKACTSVPTGTPTASDPVGKKSNGNSNNIQQKLVHICGTAPSGPSTSKPSPLHTDTSITSKQACLQLGKQTNGCKSVEFGKPSTNGQQECLLFNVAASSLPVPSNGQTFVAYDVGC